MKVAKILPWIFFPSNGVGLVFKFSFLIVWGSSSSKTIKSATFCSSKLGLLIPKIFAVLIVKKEIALLISIIFLCTKSKVIENKVSIPDAPTEAAEKGWAFVSFDLALWSDAIASIVPSWIPSIIASLSSSLLRGGDYLNAVL